jgi:hypothetical protein
MPDELTQPDPIRAFKDRCIANMLDMIKGVKVQGILYVPAKDLDPGTRSYIYTELTSIAKLYETEAKL